MKLMIAVLTAALLASPALAAGDPAQGHRLAELWCSSCHLVDPEGHGTDAAPSFPSIAERRRDDQAWLRAWLISPHPPMPNLNLSRAEIDNIVAYLGNLSR
jgi:mono/diheme cytochrome c family protein